MADPGEFTRTAFLNGKIDLTKAEGIEQLVHAQSKQQWLAGRSLSTGKLSTEVGLLRNILLEALGLLEARIDFPDEEETKSV